MSIDKMLLRIPKHVQAALKAEFHLQVKTAYTIHLNDKLVTVQATVPQAALPSLPLIVPNITPAKEAKPVTETSGSSQGKRKASSDACPGRNIMNPIKLFANATIVAAASAAAAIAAVTTAATATKVTTTAAAGGTSSSNAFEVPDSDFDASDDTMPPACPKKEHGITIILGMDIKNHLKSI
jgi:hypothetical protein